MNRIKENKYISEIYIKEVSLPSLSDCFDMCDLLEHYKEIKEALVCEYLYLDVSYYIDNKNH